MLADWIDFGQVSAERDENLSEYFFENGVLEAVLGDRHQFLVLGRKGAGKTAVFQHFKNNPRKYIGVGDFSDSLSLQDYSWDVHSLLASKGKATSLAYIQSWKYVIYLNAIKCLHKKGARGKKIDAAIKLVQRIYSSPSPTLSQMIGSKIFQLTSLKLPAGGVDLAEGNLDALSVSGGEISFSDVQKDESLQNSLNQSIERLSEIFEEALLDTISEESKVFITFDRVDEAWDRDSFGESQKVIAGLIGAAETITSKFRGALRPVVFLREDIFDSLDINDKNKLRADCGQLLAWTKDSLSRMLLERVNYFARKSGVAEYEKVDALFDRPQMRQGRAPFDYINLRTMVRPRDFIRSFQLIKGDMLSRKENPYDPEAVNEEYLECQSIYNSESAYSEWLVEELKDEWRVQYPAINDLFAALQNNGATTLSIGDLSDSLAKAGIKSGRSDLTSYLRFLYDNSIIGFRVGASQQWRFRCFFKAQGFIEADVYKVHDGLHRGLNLTESRSPSQKK
ncbi:P-loop ATPase, Sll1717 family [Limimaricola hongkongensis]|uniref:ATPase n=1 Tax=Limimaricola hongkongensis DSM 17492 TaxID=1122180 RepID=A0A017HDP1_9RHOB|nr:ATPase [Limimaricola hongkongensis]EYD72278.1 hypothetical protein Lokhon_01071 [Limimaricola hongkongensis DSM 17492]